MEVDHTWMPTLLCALKDAIKYNDGLRHSETIRDAEDIEEWMLQISHLQDYLRDQLRAEPENFTKYQQYFDE